MAFKTAHNVACVQIFGTKSGQDVMNDLYYAYETQPTHEELVTLAGNIGDVITEDWLAYLPSDWVGRSVFAYDMTVSDGANAVDDGIAGSVGTAGGDPLPNNATLALARKNGLRGRSGNGRVFWMGLSKTMTPTVNEVGSVWYEAMLAALNTADEAAVTGGAERPVILSFQRNHVVSTEATVYDLAEWVVTDNTIDSRRRRMPKRGS